MVRKGGGRGRRAGQRRRERARKQAGIGLTDRTKRSRPGQRTLCRVGYGEGREWMMGWEIYTVQ